VNLPTPLLVRSPNWLGDAVMTMPAVANLRKLLGREPLTVAAPASIAPLWEMCPFVDVVIALDHPKKLWHSSRQLSNKGFRSAVLFLNSLRTALEARLAGIPTIIGYGGRGREWLGVRTIKRRSFDFQSLHQKNDWLHLVAACGADSQESPIHWQLQFELTEQTIQNPIIICPGAEYGPAKCWPEDYYVILAQQLISRYSLPILFMGTKSDASLGAHLAQRVPGSINLCGKTTLQEFIFRLARARLVICNDSGGMHLAGILRIPTIAIFGSTEPRLTGPLGNTVRVLRHHVPCGPCFLRHCPLDFSCMTGILPAHVLTVCDDLMGMGTLA